MSSKPVRAVSKTAGISSVADEGLLLVNAALETIAVDEGATYILSEERSDGDWSHARLSLPGEIRDILNSGNTTDLPAAKMNFRLGKVSYSCRVFLLKRPADGVHSPILALHLQRHSSVSDAVYLLAAEYNLTDREQQALEAIAAGLTSKETAKKMNISPNTVKSFLRIIMLKMGVGSRAAIVGKLLEYTKVNGDGFSSAAYKE